MAGMTDKDVKEVLKTMKEMMIQAQSQHHAMPEILKATSQDKDMSALAKKMSTSFAAFHKDGRAVFDKVSKM